MECLHMSGASNDFVVLDARDRTMDFSALAKELCAKTGADGFMAADYSQIADFRLHFYNADGTRGEMCGNGARCICRFAYEHGFAESTMSIQTDAGIIYGTRLDESQYRIQLNNPSIVDLQRHPDAAYIELGDPGIPHCVTEYPQLEWSQKEALRPRFLRLRHAKVFPKGVNVNFYRWLDDRTVRLLTFERGVEDYTLACGTGSASVATVLWLQGKLPNKHLQVVNAGGTLHITLETQNETVTGLYLEGPTELLQTLDI